MYNSIECINMFLHILVFQWKIRMSSINSSPVGKGTRLAKMRIPSAAKGINQSKDTYKSADKRRLFAPFSSESLSFEPLLLLLIATSKRRK